MQATNNLRIWLDDRKSPGKGFQPLTQNLDHVMFCFRTFSTASLAVAFTVGLASDLLPQQIDATPTVTSQDAQQATGTWDGPIKDVTFQLLWLIESEDENRKPYAGAATAGLTKAGFKRLVQAGSVSSGVTVGKRSTISGKSRYGQLTSSVTLLNTTEEGELQIDIQAQMKAKSPSIVETTVRGPLNRWFLLASTDSRTGLPLHADDGSRAVLIIRITEGVILLD